MECATRWMNLLVLLSILLFVSVRAIEDDYDDYVANSTVTASNTTTNATENEKHALIAKQLKCPKLILQHKGRSVEAVRADSIFIAPQIQRTAPANAKNRTRTTNRAKPEEIDSNSTASGLPGSEFELPPGILDGHDTQGGAAFPLGGGGGDLFGGGALPDFDEPDPLAALLGGQEPEDDGFGLPKPTKQDDKQSKGQKQRNLASGHDTQQLQGTTGKDQKERTKTSDDKQKQNSTAVNRQGSQPESSKNGSSVVTGNLKGNHSTTLDNKNGTNSTEIPECSYAFDDDGHVVRWYEVIAQNGGVPGEVNATRLKPKAAKVLEPCHRPITNTTPPLQDLLYKYELIEYEKVYRSEKAFRRFAGTPSEFVDIIGQMIWVPPGFERRYFRLYYRKDDTGFYVTIRKRQKCVFEKKPLSVSCTLVHDFSQCTDNSTLRSLSPGLQASLIG